MIEFFRDYTTAATAFSIIFAALLVAYIETIIYRRIEPKLSSKGHPWQLSFLCAAHNPLRVLIGFLGFFYAADQFADLFFSEFIEPIKTIGSAVIFVWFCVRLTRNVEKQMLVRDHKSLDETSIRAISQLLRVSILITTTLVVLQSFGVPVSGVIAFGGIGAAAVGFAAKDLLGNFFGGLMIFLDRPFAIGDWVRSPDRDIEGVVEDIGWRVTRLRTFDKRPLYVPNGVISSISIENPSRMRNRRIKTFIGVRYEDASRLPLILEKVRSMLKNHPEIDTTQFLMVNFTNFGPSSLDFMIYTFTKTTNWAKFQDVQEDVFFKVLDIISQNGAEVAFPTQTLHVHAES